MTSVTAGPAPPVVGIDAHGGDPVGRADALRRDVARCVADLTGTDPRLPDIYVGWTAALEVARCPARYRADGEDGWGFPGWSAPLAAAAVGRAALARHLGLVDDASALPAPLEVVRAWLRDATRAPTTAVAEWVAQLARAGDRTSVAATAAAATRWVAGVLRVHGWPLPDRFGIVCDDADGPHARRWPKRWRPLGRGSSISIASSPDAVVGKVAATGEFDLVVHRPSSPPDEALADRAAFEAAAGALSVGIVAAGVVISTGDTGERVRFPVDGRRLTRGANLVVEVVRHRMAAAVGEDDDARFTDGTPGPACRHCPYRRTCPAGRR